MSDLASVIGLRFAYPNGTIALDDVTLTIANGEFLALIGQNGSGKTTLCKCIAGLLKPVCGSVTVAGLDPHRKGTAKRLAQKIGYVFQNPDHQLFNQTVRAEIAYGPRHLGIRQEEITKLVRKAAAAAGVGSSIFDSHPHFLHKGQRQRVAIASVLAMHPQIIIVDEPSTGQDCRQSEEIMDFLRTLQRRHGHTILMTTHDMRMVARYASRIVVLARGHVLLDGTPREVFAQPETLAKAHVRPPQVTRLGQSLAHIGAPSNALSVAELSGALERIWTA